MLTACNNSKTKEALKPVIVETAVSNQEKNITGTFTLGDKTYTGKVSIQNLEATGQFSVLCQDDTDPTDPILIQFVFKDEASARTEDYKTPAYDQGKDQAANEAAVIFELNYKR